MQLPIIDCRECGACCTNIGNPPFLGFEILDLPAKLKIEILDLLDNHHYRETNKSPCYWFDQITLKCKHYEHRPQICRDFDIGSISCLSYREVAKLAAIHKSIIDD